MPLIAGVDSSTQSCKVVIRDAETGELLRSGRASHPDATEVDPEAWWTALGQAVAEAGGLDDVAAISVGGQQHGMVCLDDAGTPVRPALLWNDNRSAPAAEALIAELGAEQAGDGDAVSKGKEFWARACGSSLVASITITKLRWLAENEPANADRTAAVCLPHDYVSFRLAADGAPPPPGAGESRSGRAAASNSRDLRLLWTDRSEASGTGYWCPSTGEYRPELLQRAFGRLPRVPRVVGPIEAGGATLNGVPIGPGSGDNAAAALALGMGPGDIAVSIGTSGVVSAICEAPVADASGMVQGFADATGRFLPLTCTLNGSRVLSSTAELLGVDFAELDRLALAAPAGAGGAVLVPYFEGERTPTRPDATASLLGLTGANYTRENLARAAVEALLCALADGLDALVALGVPVRRVLLIGGGSKSEAVRALAPSILGAPVIVPVPGEYVADGAARQAAAVALGDFPTWGLPGAITFEADPTPFVRDRYAEATGYIMER